MSAGTRPAWDAQPVSLTDVIQCAQADVVDRLQQAIGTGRFHRARYQDWLAIESAACRIAALSLDAVADWHRQEDDLHATAIGWADELRGWVQLAAADVRRLDGIAAAMPPALAAWHAFHLKAGGSQRAGEALGAAVLQARLLEGPAREPLEALCELPFTHSASAYLFARLHANPGHAGHEGRAALLDAYSNTALIAGAQRGAEWMREAFLDVFATPSR